MSSPGTASTNTHIVIDGQPFLLDGDRDLVDLMGEIEAAARSEPTFVHLSAGDELVSVLVSSRSRIVITVERDGIAVTSDEAPIAPLPDWEY
ncbi:hypothetical protein [Microbacterium sp. MYb66]|jgi:hypothetical protein|uniref:hypothetical protein n=1 Tax=Microbacterium sp. MYb66 TaxID=1848692 RepID=UPI000D00B3D3|nr:hypothetical protein [Microbacterium sp. MYb66]PRA82239.1 hypothetical protein CQ045_06040 [Microbacterium sp. MYb66]